MRVKTFSSFGQQHEFGALRWDAAFVGIELDKRCAGAAAFAKSSATKTHVVEYSVDQPRRLRFDSQLLPPKGLTAALAGYKSVVFETTSVGTVEVLHLLRAAKEAGVRSVDCLYVEPRDYEKDTYLDTSWSRDFSLSSSHRIAGVPGFLSTQGDLKNHQVRMVAFLGYESSRLAAAAQQELDMAGWDKYAVVGVPGFAPGWEINTLANNIDELDVQQFCSIRYCSASSVSGALDLLRQIHNEGNRDTPHTAVAPMGTKPHGIAAAIFLVENSGFQESSLLYDHPLRVPGRTSEIRRWHLYRIDMCG